MPAYSALLLSLLLASGCGDRRSSPAASEDPPAQAASDAAIAPPRPTALPAADEWPALSTRDADRQTADGIPVMVVGPSAPGERGGVRWVSDIWSTLQIPTREVSDGARLYVAVTGRAAEFSDVVIRDGVIYRNLLRHLAESEAHPGGCAAAINGDLLLSAPRDPTTMPAGGQRTWLLGAGGTLTARDLPLTEPARARCKAWLDADGRFVVGLLGLVTWDGEELTTDRSWFAGRTEMASARGPRFCFRSCNKRERDAKTEAVVAKLKKAMGCSPELHLYRNWLAGDCRREGRVGRMAIDGGKAELLDKVPRGRINHGDRLAFTASGDLVIGLDYGMRSYVVWRLGAAELSPQRSLAATEILARASPTLLVRGLPPRVPTDSIPATLLGEPISFGASGSTVGHAQIHRGKMAREAAVARAVAVLPRSGKLVVAHEAVVDLTCGSYVRSPIGWEGQSMHDWIPPQLPPLSKKAVYDPPQCQPLAEVVAVPGAPDLLLARAPTGELLMAWLPPPLPLPQGRNARSDEPAKPAEAQNPRPGSGWTRLDRVDSIAGIRGQPAPGENQQIERRSWLAGGAAIVTIGGDQLLIGPHGVFTVPAEARPMAMMQYEGGLYGAIGGKLLACRDSCRVIDPGVGSEIVAVVPRSRELLVLGYAHGQNGLYQVPELGGRTLRAHPSAAAIRTVLAQRPRP